MKVHTSHQIRSNPPPWDVCKSCGVSGEKLEEPCPKGTPEDFKPPRWQTPALIHPIEPEEITEAQKAAFVAGLRELSERTGVRVEYVMDEGMFLTAYANEGYSTRPGPYPAIHDVPGRYMRTELLDYDH